MERIKTMNYDLAVSQLLEGWKERLPMGFLPLVSRDEKGMSPGHIRFMLEEILDKKHWSDGKKGRWLGWAQAMLCFHGFFRLGEMKSLNLACSCDDEGCPQYNRPHIHQE